MNPSKDCSVCTDLETPENCILTCTGCGIKVHMLCYGVERFKENWKCSPCSRGKKNRSCKLCLENGEAMKPTVCGNWVHVICALFTDGVIIVDVNRMDPVDISQVSKSKLNKTCSFCEKTQGFCCLCAQYKCNNRLHITCAKKSDCLIEKINPKDQTIKFRAYCREHKPTSSSRRISTQFVPKVAVKKGKNNKKTEKQQRSASANCNWITNASNESVQIVDTFVDVDEMEQSLLNDIYDGVNFLKEVDLFQEIRKKKSEKRKRKNRYDSNNETVKSSNHQVTDDIDKFDEVAHHNPKRTKGLNRSSDLDFEFLSDQTESCDFNGLQLPSPSAESSRKKEKKRSKNRSDLNKEVTNSNIHQSKHQLDKFENVTHRKSKPAKRCDRTFTIRTDTDFDLQNDQSMSWDFNGFKDLSPSGALFVDKISCENNKETDDKENYDKEMVIIEDHICFKDAKIFKVCLEIDFLAFFSGFVF